MVCGRDVLLGSGSVQEAVGSATPRFPRGRGWCPSQGIQAEWSRVAQGKAATSLLHEEPLFHPERQGRRLPLTLARALQGKSQAPVPPDFLLGLPAKCPGALCSGPHQIFRRCRKEEGEHGAGKTAGGRRTPCSHHRDLFLSPPSWLPRIH